jgi:hypothetical protein
MRQRIARRGVSISVPVARLVFVVSVDFLARFMALIVQ